jgi:polar amino acid transport system substrate-binding protein
MKTASFRLIGIFFFLATSIQFTQAKQTLRLGFFDTTPFVMQSDKNLEGVSYWLWNKINFDHTFTSEFIETPFDNLIEGLANNELDISLTPLTITSERNKKIDFSTPYYISNSGILVLQHSFLENSAQFILSFFSIKLVKVLSALFSIILFFGFLVWLFERKENTEQFSNNRKGIWNGIWWSAVTMTTVGYGDKSPTTVGGRIVALIWMFTAIIIISGFTASIASSLTVNQTNWNQSHISEFKHKKLGTVKKSATASWLTQNFFRQVVRYEKVEDAIIALENGEIDAVAYDEPILQSIVLNKKKHILELLPIQFNTQMLAFGLSVKMPTKIKDLINKRIIAIIESYEWKVVLTEYKLNKY